MTAIWDLDNNLILTKTQSKTAGSDVIITPYTTFQFLSDFWEHDATHSILYLQIVNTNGLTELA